MWNHSSPGWGASTGYRAFVFPVVHPYSTLCVALMESDTHEEAGLMRHLDGDDVLGRVTIRLSQLFARTQYDCWFAVTGKAEDGYKAYVPYSHETTGRTADGNPAIRLRYSVSFSSEKARMLAYLTPSSPPPLGNPPLHELAFASSSAKSHMGGAKFALFGPAEAYGEYNWDVRLHALPRPSTPFDDFPVTSRDLP